MNINVSVVENNGVKGMVLTLRVTSYIYMHKAAFISKSAGSYFLFKRCKSFNFSAGELSTST